MRYGEFKRFSFKDIKLDDSTVKAYTRVISTAFLCLFNKLMPNLERIQYFKGVKSLQTKSYQS